MSSLRALAVLSYAQGFTLWHYRANQPVLGETLFKPCTRAEVLARGFFDKLGNTITSGDMMLVSCVDGGLMLYMTESGNWTVMRESIA